ncbi:GNAT family N-acetyltransferase [Paenibacillus sp. P96]|uniref:GNAT family N-acetyltransferase n=1 Tax=Paenibacillus zeirhizosphaerae TaxID=2987519 RepID=A0ABT9FKU8_9BACL|nr:GNAT family protein [Paenibacillus sp. P96]MDP4095354.1 GNAT family N-acetyltransferase [Paenibacillus sp. P96]
MNTSSFHSLEGEYICFKSLSSNNVKEIHSYASDEDVSRFIGWNLMNTFQAVIGTAMIFNFDKEANHAEIGYVLHKEHWGKGYGTEAVGLMSEFAFESLQLHKLYASVVDANIGSARILEKSGYALEGRLKDHYFIEDNYYDALLYGKITKLALERRP